MPGRLRETVARMYRAALAHKVTTAVFALGLAAIIALGAVAAASGSSASATGTSGSRPGGATKQQAPDFTLAMLGRSSGQVSLASYAGRPVIVNFFASWCAPCRKETPLLARYYRAADGRVDLVGIDSNDSRSAAAAFTRNAGVSYPLAYDPAATAAGTFGVTVLPQTFFLNAEHRIVDRVFGAVTAADLAKGVALMNSGAKAS